MAKNQEGGTEPGSASSFAPATYRLVGIDKDVKEVYVPLLSRTYTLDDLKRQDILTALALLGWEHVEKIA